MPTPRPDLDIPSFERKLHAELSGLRERIHDILLRSDAEAYGALAGQVHDIEEEALADLLVDVSLADLTREVEKVRDVDAALRRILTGTYGICIRCGEPIDRKRLEVYPTAKRCQECQRAHERSTLAPLTPTL